MNEAGLINTPSSILVQWHAHPMSAQEATRVLLHGQHLLQSRIGRKKSYLIQLQLMCARYWLGEFDHYDFELMSRTMGSTRRLQALLYLTYGQLLISCKSQEAFGYLDRGQRLADGIVKPEDYFIIFNRHHDLRSLKLSGNACNGLSLQSLLTEAAVIDKFNPGREVEMIFRPAEIDTLLKNTRNE